MQSYLVGRKSKSGRLCDIELPSDEFTVSRRHLEIRVGGDESIVVRDVSDGNVTEVLRSGAWREVHEERVGPDEPLMLGDYETTARKLLAMVGHHLGGDYDRTVMFRRDSAGAGRSVPPHGGGRELSAPAPQSHYPAAQPHAQQQYAPPGYGGMPSAHPGQHPAGYYPQGHAAPYGPPGGGNQAPVQVIVPQQESSTFAIITLIFWILFFPIGILLNLIGVITGPQRGCFVSMLMVFLVLPIVIILGLMGSGVAVIDDLLGELLKIIPGL